MRRMQENRRRQELLSSHGNMQLHVLPPVHAHAVYVLAHVIECVRRNSHAPGSGSLRGADFHLENASLLAYNFGREGKCQVTTLHFPAARGIDPERQFFRFIVPMRQVRLERPDRVQKPDRRTVSQISVGLGPALRR